MPELKLLLLRVSIRQAELSGRIKSTNTINLNYVFVQRHAAEVIMDNPAALQLRYLQTLNSISAENNSTIVFPVPIDIISSLMSSVQNNSTTVGEWNKQSVGVITEILTYKM